MLGSIVRFGTTVLLWSILTGELACTLDSQRVGGEPEPAPATPELCEDTCARRVQCGLAPDDAECIDMCEVVEVPDDACADAREDHLGCLLTLSCDDLEAAEAQPDQGGCAQTHEAKLQACP